LTLLRTKRCSERAGGAGGLEGVRHGRQGLEVGLGEGGADAGQLAGRQVGAGGVDLAPLLLDLRANSSAPRAATRILIRAL
jgi:hypothetical protein